MRTFRVVCTHNPSGTIVDFAAADDAQNSIITHNNLLKLRQYHTPDSENLLPPLMLHDDNEQTSVDFDKPNLATDEQRKLLQKTTPRILAEYNKFKYRDQNSTLQITEETLAVAYDFINPYTMQTSSAEEENFKQQLINSQRLQNAKAMRHHIGAKTPSLAEKFYKSNGD